MSSIPVKELRELKSLLDEGILTDSEYESLKRKLLNLPEITQNKVEAKDDLAEEDSIDAERDPEIEDNDIIADMMAPMKQHEEKMRKLLGDSVEDFAANIFSEESPLNEIFEAKRNIESEMLPSAIAKEEYDKLTDEDKAYLKRICHDQEAQTLLHYSYGTELRNRYNLWNSYDADEVSAQVISILAQMAFEDKTVDYEIGEQEPEGASKPISLDVAKELVYQENSAENIRTLASVFLNYVNSKEVVPTYFQVERDTKLFELQNNGLLFNAISSCQAMKMPHPKCTIIDMDINYVLTSIFDDKRIGGLAVDPFQPIGLYLPKDMLLKIMIHGKYEDQNNGGTDKRDWGVGIPEYTEEDLMTKGELLNFAMHTIIDNDLDKNGYRIISACDNTEAIANIIAEKDEKTVLIAVTGYCAEDEPELELERKLRLQALGDCFNAECYYAPVGFRSSTDLLRFNQCLALKGDGFYSKYEGLKNL